jgi:bifunctional N-acetylglucosamine-1-phosphate-uridyltransferase/glucosamine-1-phosphate-acetyltransferase GlmU-like protein
MVLKQNDTFTKTFFNKNIFIGSKSLIVSGLKIKCQNSIIGTCSVISKDLIATGKYFSKKIKKII